MKTLKVTTKCTPEELKGLADDMRQLADDIESGDILAITWVEHRTRDLFKADWIKTKGISKVELLGGATALVHEISNSLLKDDQIPF